MPSSTTTQRRDRKEEGPWSPSYRDPSDAIVSASYRRLMSQVRFYQDKFPHIPTLSSPQLLEWQMRRQQQLLGGGEGVGGPDVPPSFLLVDVRFPDEQRISMIAGAIPLATLEQAWQQQPHLRSSSASSSTSLFLKNQRNLAEDNVLICYCTIGYRSGMEATRLLLQYPQHLAGKTVYNLDGLVAYTHALPKCPPASSSSSNQPAWGLIDPQTGQATTLVHTFGPAWNHVSPAESEPTTPSSSSSFTAVYYARFRLLRRLIDMALWIAWRYSQRAGWAVRRTFRRTPTATSPTPLPASSPFPTPSARVRY